MSATSCNYNDHTLGLSMEFLCSQQSSRRLFRLHVISKKLSHGNFLCLLAYRHASSSPRDRTKKHSEVIYASMAQRQLASSKKSRSSNIKMHRRNEDKALQIHKITQGPGRVTNVEMTFDSSKLKLPFPFGGGFWNDIRHGSSGSRPKHVSELRPRETTDGRAELANNYDDDDPPVRRRRTRSEVDRDSLRPTYVDQPSVAESHGSSRRSESRSRRAYEEPDVSPLTAPNLWREPDYDPQPARHSSRRPRSPPPAAMDNRRGRPRASSRAGSRDQAEDVRERMEQMNVGGGRRARSPPHTAMDNHRGRSRAGWRPPADNRRACSVVSGVCERSASRSRHEMPDHHSRSRREGSPQRRRSRRGSDELQRTVMTYIDAQEAAQREQRRHERSHHEEPPRRSRSRRESAATQQTGWPVKDNFQPYMEPRSHRSHRSHRSERAPGEHGFYPEASSVYSQSQSGRRYRDR